MSDLRAASVYRPRATLGLALFAALAIAPARAPAQIYECIDAGGRKEFTQKCPPGTVTQRQVSKGGTSNLNAGGTPPQTMYREQEGAFRQRQIEREASEAKARAAAADAASKCQKAQSQLVAMESARRISAGPDPQTGQPRYLDDNERAAATQKARDAVTLYCK